MNPVLSFTNEDGSALEDNSVKFHVKAGFESSRKIKVTNVHLEPVQMSNPRPCTSSSFYYQISNPDIITRPE